MLAVLEMIDEENKKIFRRGEKKAKRETVRKLLAAKIPIEVIIDATGLTEKEVKKLENA